MLVCLDAETEIFLQLSGRVWKLEGVFVLSIAIAKKIEWQKLKSFDLISFSILVYKA